MEVRVAKIDLKSKDKVFDEKVMNDIEGLMEQRKYAREAVERLREAECNLEDINRQLGALWDLARV